MNEIEKGQLASETIQCLSDVGGSLDSFPKLLMLVIKEKVWLHRVDQGRRYVLPNLRALITEKPMAGWGEDPKKIEAIIKDMPEVLAAFREEMKGEPGRKQETDNNVIPLDTPQGNSRAYSIARVKSECDKGAVTKDTLAKVMSGEMSPNAALIKAGIRQNRQVYIPKDASKVLPKLRQVFGDDFVDLVLAHETPSN